MANTARRQREIEHARSGIVEAAAKAFSKLGFDRTTIHDIAHEAGYSTTTLYSYFEGKEQIVDALASSMAEDLEAAFETSFLSSMTFVQKLEVLLTRWVSFGQRWRDALSVLFALRTVAKSTSKRQSPLLRNDYFVEKLASWLRNNATSEELGGNDPAALAYILSGILHGANRMWRAEKYQGDPSRFAALAMRIFLHGISESSPAKREGAERKTKSNRR